MTKQELIQFKNNKYYVKFGKHTIMLDNCEI